MGFEAIGQKSGNPDTTITINTSKSSSDFVGIIEPSPVDARQYCKHQIAIDPADSTAGTITVTATANGNTDAEPVFIDVSGVDTAWVIDLSEANEPLTRTIVSNSLANFKFAGASMNGSNDWTVTITSGD